jgi:hypothetical protein
MDASMNELAQTDSKETNQWFKVVLFAGMLLFAFYASTHMVAAGDTWVAMACGRHFDNHGVDTVEPFSFNSHPAGPSEETLEKYPDWTHGIKKWHPTGWINQNWLTHLIFYKLASWFGDDGSYNYNTLVYWKFAIYFLAVICIYATGKLMGAGDFLSAAGACFAMVVGRTFYDIRPSGYSNLLVPVLLLIFALAVYRNYRLIWLIVPVVVFWANVHGGYLYAFIMLVPFIGVHLLLRLPRRWSICLGFIGLWLVLYLMSYKFISNTNYLTVQKVLNKSDAVPILFKDKILIIWALLAVGSVALTVLKTIKSQLFYAYHIGIGAIYFLTLAPRFFMAEIPRRLTPHFKEIYSHFVFSSQMTFVLVSLVGCLLILVMSLKKERFIALSFKGIHHTIGAGVVSFIAMIVFNPFHLTNLTHTFEISVSKHAESWRQVNEWKPAFDWMDKTTTKANRVGDEEAFGVLCILTFAALLCWLVGHFLKPKPTMKRGRRNQQAQIPEGSFQWPKIDLAMIVISLLTVYMAIRSRRFIAIAGSAAAATVFLMILQIWQMFSARFSWKTEGLLRPIPWPPVVLKSIRTGTLFVVLGFGLFWGMKYKYVYLDPWPTDNRYNTVFMRMTASHLKPFEVCRFINDNNISGRVFNYWTEGGAVAFGQTPDEKTGKVPLKLFMDGRAQAAYNHDIFKLWQNIHSGGPIIQTARQKKQKIDAKILTKAGSWIDTQLKANTVWTVLMPKAQENSIFMRALKKTTNWKTAYFDNTQHILVDAETPQGKTLLDSIIAGTAVFPDAFSENLTTAAVIIETKNAKRYKDLHTLTKAAFDERPCPTSARAMTRLTGLTMFREKVAEYLKSYVDDFVQNKETYMKKDGYFQRAASAEIASRSLIKMLPKEKDRYLKYANQFRAELKPLSKSRIW